MTQPDETVVRVISERENTAHPGWEVRGLDAEFLYWPSTNTWVKAPDYLHSIDAIRPVMAKLMPAERSQLTRKFCNQFADLPYNDQLVWHLLTLDPNLLAKAVCEAILACRVEKGGG